MHHTLKSLVIDYKFLIVYQSFPLIERIIYEYVFSCTDGEMGCQPALPVWKRGLNRRSYTEGEAKYLSDSAEVLSAPHRRVSQLNFNTMTHFDKHIFQHSGEGDYSECLVKPLCLMHLFTH